MDFSDKIRQYRKDNNLTQEELAGKLLISRQAVSKWEQGRGYQDINHHDLISTIKKRNTV